MSEGHQGFAIEGRIGKVSFFNSPNAVHLRAIDSGDCVAIPNADVEEMAEVLEFAASRLSKSPAQRKKNVIAVSVKRGDGKQWR